MTPDSLPVYMPNNWVWWVEDKGAFWSSGTKSWSEAGPKYFTHIATEAELCQVLKDAGYPECAPKNVPDTVKAWQAKAALAEAGIFDLVEAKLKAAGGANWFAWEYADTYSRNSPLLNAVGKEFNLSETAIDQLFIRAASLKV